MTIIFEAARLFFAMAALVLVGLLSAPMGGDFSHGQMTVEAKEKNPSEVPNHKVDKKKTSTHKTLKVADKKIEKRGAKKISKKS